MEKRILGLLLALAGAAVIIYAGIQFVNGMADNQTRKVIMYGVLGLIFFMSGIGLLKSVRDTGSK